MDDCINSVIPKTAWCKGNRISEEQFFYWQRILYREAFENSLNSSLPATAGQDQGMAPATQRTVSFTGLSFHHLLRVQPRSFTLISWSPNAVSSCRFRIALRLGCSHGLEGFWVLNNATGFWKIYIAVGYTDLRCGIDGTASTIKFNF